MNQSNWSFVIAAYSIAWIVILGYFFRLHRLLRRARAYYERAGSAPRVTR